MGFIELLLTAVGLSADAFAVALCKGLSMRARSMSRTLIIAAFFGVFQGLMPLIGWLLGIQFERYIVHVDHWLVFALLSFIGGRMIYEAFHDEADCPPDDGFDLKELLLLAVATSIDALAVGISFAFLEVSILPAVLLIGVTTFLLSVLGVDLGNRFGVRFKKKAEVAGGCILCLLGLKILLEHLGLLAL